MAGIVSTGSNREANAFSHLTAKLAFFEKQMKILEKLWQTECDGGFKKPALPDDWVSYSIENTIREIDDKAKELEEGDLTDSEIFELLERMLAARDDAKSKLDGEWVVVIDGIIVAIIYCVND